MQTKQIIDYFDGWFDVEQPLKQTVIYVYNFMICSFFIGIMNADYVLLGISLILLGIVVVSSHFVTKWFLIALILLIIGVMVGNAWVLGVSLYFVAFNLVLMAFYRLVRKAQTQKDKVTKVKK